MHIGLRDDARINVPNSLDARHLDAFYPMVPKKDRPVEYWCTTSCARGIGDEKLPARAGRKSVRWMVRN